VNRLPLVDCEAAGAIVTVNEEVGILVVFETTELLVTKLVI
jgi:hypothetical protein